MLKDFVIAKNITLFILPYIFLYSFYIQINGEVSPGGGFQAGVIFASGLIGFDLIYSKHLLKKRFSIDTLIFIAVLGVVIYASVGLASLFFNMNYLDYYALASNKLWAQSIGIFAVELGVGLTVASIMCLIYFLFQE